MKREPAQHIAHLMGRVFTQALLCVVLSQTGWATTADAPATQRSNADQRKSASRSEADESENQAEIERQILEFVGEHQPKLVKLLTFLKDRRPALYHQALRDTRRSIQRLKNLAERDQELYAIELELWRLRSETRLVAGQISATKSDSNRQSLEKRLTKLIDLEIAKNLERLKLMRERTAQQVARYDALIADQESNRDARAARLLKQWQNRIDRQISAPSNGKPTDSSKAQDSDTSQSGPARQNKPASPQTNSGDS